MQEDLNTSFANSTNDTLKHGHSPSIEDMALAFLLAVVIVITLVGNTLVILAVLTTRRLRTVTNCFVMSVAVADWLVGLTVMPPAVAYRIMGTWELGRTMCDLWLSLDILLCTASILSLCVISVDRYLAVTRPLSYSRKRRSKRLAFSMILVVWVLSALITCPPMFGWYEPDRDTCRYNKNAGYVVFSAMFSFFIPMIIMLYVYVRISCIVAQRHDQLTHINPTRKGHKLVLNAKDNESELDRMSSDCEDHQVNMKCTRYQIRKFSARYEEPNTTRMMEAKPNKSEELMIIDETEKRTAKICSIVMGGFVICWMPFFIYYLLTPILSENETSSTIAGYLTWLGWINSAINPFIYAFYDAEYRRTFWKLITCALRSKQRMADVELRKEDAERRSVKQKLEIYASSEEQ